MNTTQFSGLEEKMIQKDVYKVLSKKIGTCIDADLYDAFSELCKNSKKKKARVFSDLIRAYLIANGYAVREKALRGTVLEPKK